jgi:hypothetical protein
MMIPNILFFFLHKGYNEKLAIFIKSKVKLIQETNRKLIKVERSSLAMSSNLSRELFFPL